MFDTFDPENVSKTDMVRLAEHIEEYVDQLESIMIIPEEILEKHGDQIKEGIRRAKKLINKLKKGDKSVFKDDEDRNSLM